MNKYSSKAVKTAATVGMSLAMVLGNVAPVLAASDSYTGAVADVLKALNGTSIKKTPIDKEADWDDDSSTADETLEDYVSDETNRDFLEQAADILGNEVAIHLVGSSDDDDRKTIVDKVDALETALDNLKTWYEDEGDYADEDLDDNGYKAVKPAYDTIVNYYDDYKDNLRTTDAGDVTRKESYDLYFNDMENAVTEYQDSYIGDFVDDFLNTASVGLNKTVIGDTSVSVEDLLDGKDFDRANLSDLEKFIKDVKEDKKSFGTNNIKYSAVEDDSEVQEVIDGLETVVEEIKEVNDILKSTNAVVKNYKKIDDKVKALATQAGNYDEDDDEDYVEAVNAFRTADIEKLEAYVDEVVSQFYYVEAVERTNGNYSLRLKEENYARYLNAKTDVVSTDLETLLTTNLEKDSEESVYTSLVDNRTDLEKLLDAVTTDIEGITIDSTLTDKEAAKIVAAKKALDTLYDEDGENDEAKFGSYNDALTSKEKKAIKANATLINTMYLKLILNGTVTKTGWIDNGNGNWDYLAEDGSRPTKWVAAGSDWYYVKNGTMLRNSWIASDAQGTRWYYVDDAGKMVSNTTVNGYTFNSYGVWVQ